MSFSQRSLLGRFVEIEKILQQAQQIYTGKFLLITEVLGQTSTQEITVLRQQEILRYVPPQTGVLTLGYGQKVS